MPLQERYRELAQDPGAIRAVLAAGASRAGEVAAKTMDSGSFGHRSTAALGRLRPSG